MEKQTPNYQVIITDVERYLANHGDSHLGVGWPKYPDTQVRYQVMMDFMDFSDPNKPVSFLDFGCGASHFYEFIQRNYPNAPLKYTGLDMSEKMLALSRSKFPNNTYLHMDVMKDSSALPEFDYIIMNGIFNSRITLSFEDMWEYTKELIRVLFAKAKNGIVFNVMSKHVEWERDDLFHLPMDLLADFLTKELSRHFVMRNDYGLYEYTTYLYKKPQRYSFDSAS